MCVCVLHPPHLVAMSTSIKGHCPKTTFVQKSGGLGYGDVTTIHSPVMCSFLHIIMAKQILSCNLAVCPYAYGSTLVGSVVTYGGDAFVVDCGRCEYQSAASNGAVNAHLLVALTRINAHNRDAVLVSWHLDTITIEDHDVIRRLDERGVLPVPMVSVCVWRVETAKLIQAICANHMPVPILEFLPSHVLLVHRPTDGSVGRSAAIALAADMARVPRDYDSGFGDWRPQRLYGASVAWVSAELHRRAWV